MKVLHVIDTLGVGGAEQMLANLLPRIVEAGIDCEVAVMRPPYTLLPNLAQHGIRVHCLPAFNQWRLFKGVWTISQLVRRRDIQIVHAHLLFPSIYVGLARAIGLLRAKTCVTWHNLAYEPGCNKPGPGLALRKLLNSLTTRFGMDGRLAVSRPVGEHYAKQLRVPPSVVIPNPIPLEEIDAALRERSVPSSGECIALLLPGRLVPEKGHATMVGALKILRDGGLAFRAIFAGGGPLREVIEKHVRECHLSDRITMTGVLSHADLLRMMVEADIVVTPSLFEGFGMTAAEAMAAGRSVVASRAGGLVDVIEDGVSGLLVGIGNSEELATAILKLSGDPELRRRLGVAGRRRVEERFEASLVVAQLASYYVSLINGVR